MLDDLFAKHHEVMQSVPMGYSRYFYNEINWDNQAICILGDRGVGKTTVACQYLLYHYKSHDRALYLSADNINVLAQGLFKIAQAYFSSGGVALFIDEVHKYPNWSIEVKNIIDTYKTKKIIFIGSSSLDLKKSKGDLSRRVVYYNLPGLSFREFLKLKYNKKFPSYSLKSVLVDHIEIANSFSTLPILKYFKEYLTYGYYPFFLEGEEDYLSKLNNVIEKVIYEDIAVVFKLKNTTVPALKKILWLIATTDGLTPNIDKISKDIKASREVVYDCFEYLNQAGLVINLFEDVKGMKLVRKPGKVFLNNTNLLYAINGNIKLATSTGIARETMFVNQLQVLHRVNLHNKADFVIDGETVIEVGGKNKSNRQLKGEANGILALDDMLVGYKHKVPLFLFGFLY